MVLPLPNLDDRTYADLIDEARSRIPIECPAWTDHNPSDPGIILLELLAWVTETVLYRVNQVPDANVVTFLKLLNTPGWQPSANLQADLEATILDLRERYRAVTPADYEYLLLERWPRPLNLPQQPGLPPAAAAPLARVHCIPTTRPDANEPNQLTPHLGHLTLVVMPSDPADRFPCPSPQLLTGLTRWLDPCRLLTTHHHLIGPSYVRVQLSAELHLLEGADPAQVLRAALSELQSFFSPLPSAANSHWKGQGWPFGRAVYPSEIYQMLDQLTGVDYAENLQLRRASDPVNAAAPAPLATPLELQDHELPQLEIDPAITAENFQTWFTLKERRGSGWVTVSYEVIKLAIANSPPPAASNRPGPSPGPLAPPSVQPLAPAPAVSGRQLSPQSQPLQPGPIPQPSYLDYLPALLQADPLVDKFLSAFKQVLSGAQIPSTDEACPGILAANTPASASLERVISLAHTYFDPHRTPPEFLPWLAGWVALSLQDNWPLETKQQFIDAIAPLYRQRGTKAALLKILQIYLESAGFKDVAQKAEVTEFPEYPHFFQVSLTLNSRDPNRYWQQARIAKNIIDQEKPAHTYYALRVLVPTMQVSGQMYRLELTHPGTITVRLLQSSVTSESSDTANTLLLKIRNSAPQSQVVAQSRHAIGSQGTVTYAVQANELAQSAIWYVSIANLSSHAVSGSLAIDYPNPGTPQTYTFQLSEGLKLGSPNPPEGGIRGNTLLGNQEGDP